MRSPCSPRDSQSLLQHHSSKALILRCSAFFIVQQSHPYVTTRKTIALTRQTFVGKVIPLLFNMLSRLVITFLPRSKCILISWLQSPSAVILEPPKIKSSLFPLFPHHFMGNRCGNSGNSGNSIRLWFWGAPESLQMVTAAMKLKDAYSLKGKL